MADRTGSLGPITEIFLQATAGIEPVYFQLPVAGLPESKFLICLELFYSIMLSRFLERPKSIGRTGIELLS
jgi:hypothetical protein